ncbi:hypothetical protein KDX08_32865 [Burkholderia cenocepacia]|uniref:hypothetical protein n=1 Tax=Burkholderia cenocepacia TaxID=95486 RepID=UPI0012AEC68C|nr:hypothetical protein [Burkholderia cenocepacia]MBR7997254.1 hypothetical protein [Burkholderia cenocepacia]
MNEKAWLMGWIHRIEEYACTKDDLKFKRIHAIVLELCFERVLSKTERLGLPHDLVHGWSYCTPYGGNSRHWFLISRDLTNQSDRSSIYPQVFRTVNRTFATTLLRSRPNDKVFVVSFRIDQTINHANTPCLNWKFVECELHGNLIDRCDDQSTAKRYESSVTENVESGINSAYSIRTQTDIRSWLQGLDGPSLRRLFATRCFMNFSGLFLSDIDGIGIDQHGQGTVIEFKRKMPARGYVLTPVRPSPENVPLGSYVDLIRELKQLDKETRSQRLSDETRFIKEKSARGFYGLDESHFMNVRLCDDIGFTYRYIVWHSGTSDAVELVRPDFHPKARPSLESHIVTPTCFAGFSKTDSKDSGSYSNKTRFQLMIAASKFRPCE